MLVARRLLVSGRVQGVGFRYFVREAALVEGVRGWVANRADGRVELRIEGDAEAIERLERHIRRGPPGARVDDVEWHDEAPTGRWTDFEVRTSARHSVET